MAKVKMCNSLKFNYMENKNSIYQIIFNGKFILDTLFYECCDNAFFWFKLYCLDWVSNVYTLKQNKIQKMIPDNMSDQMDII